MSVACKTKEYKLHIRLSVGQKFSLHFELWPATNIKNSRVKSSTVPKNLVYFVITVKVKDF